ncbi:MAG: insulinase family protein [Deltaproteobacteria bacterium]|nr:insulinase family protein [Deltaproteobacteria bacterium]
MKKLLLLMLVACHSATPAATTPAPAPAPAPAPEPMKPAPPPPEAPKMVTQTAQPQNLQFPDEDFRTKQPAAGPPRPFKLPPVKPFTLKNGIKVYLVEQHTLPIVSMDLNFDGGSLTDPKGKDGLAGVCTQLLTEGTDKLDKIQYSEALADIASSINAYAADDSQGVTLSSLTKHLDATFALFSDTILTPGLRAPDFDRLLKRRIESVKQQRGNPTSIPGRVMGKVLYGATHPLGSVTTEQSLAAITLDDCKKQLATWMKPKNARLFVVGDVTEAQIKDAFEKSPLAKWSGAAPAEPRLPPAKTLPGRIFFVNVPKAAQSSVMVLQLGPTRTAPDYFASSMMGAVFGGSFTSRLNMNLREDKGYSYGARGGFSYPLKSLGVLTVSAPVQADATYQALREVDREMKELASGKTPVTKDELEREKTNAILALPGRFSTAGAALGQYRSLVYYGLPLDYFNTYVANVQKVNEAQAKAAAAKNLRPGQAVYLVVGDGDAKMIVHNDKSKKDDPADVRRLPYQKDGKQLTLREALTELAKSGDVGSGGLVELDVDGAIVH